MNELIESGDPRAKVVGKRPPPAAGEESLAAAGKLIALTNQLRIRPFRARKGVHRFRTFEEADEWMMNLYLR